MQVKFARFIASCALALGALLPFAPVAQAQTEPAAATAAVAAPADAAHNPYGIEAASQIYLGKSARELTWGEDGRRRIMRKRIVPLRVVL